MNIDKKLLEKQIKVLALQLNKDITKEERDAFEELLSLLGDIVDAPGIDKEAANAEHYLSIGEELTIPEMIQAIKAHEDKHDLIDNVGGVVVWEKLEGQISCRDFLKMI